MRQIYGDNFQPTKKQMEQWKIEEMELKKKEKTVKNPKFQKKVENQILKFLEFKKRTDEWMRLQNEKEGDFRRKEIKNKDDLDESGKPVETQQSENNGNFQRNSKEFQLPTTLLKCIKHIKDKQLQE